jgi:hypothetical protein
MSERYKDFMLEDLEVKKVLHFKRMCSEHSNKSYLEICAEVLLGEEGKVGTSDDGVEFLREEKKKKCEENEDVCEDPRSPRMKSFCGQWNIECVLLQY